MTNSTPPGDARRAPGNRRITAVSPPPGDSAGARPGPVGLAGAGHVRRRRNPERAGITPMGAVRTEAWSGQEDGGQEDHGDEARGGQQHAVAGQGLGRPVAGGVHEDVLGARQAGGGDRHEQRRAAQSQGRPEPQGQQRNDGEFPGHRHPQCGPALAPVRRRPGPVRAAARRLGDRKSVV